VWHSQPYGANELYATVCGILSLVARGEIMLCANKFGWWVGRVGFRSL
jgi:hypothetical protein